MKRYIKSASVIICAALALASCTKTEEIQHNPDNALQIESVSGISPFALMQNTASKAVITGETLPGDEAAKGIGLFVTATDGSAYDGHDKGYTNVKYTFDGSKWSAQSPIYLSDTPGKLYGYFPYNQNACDLRAIPVASSLNGTDYLYAEAKTVDHSNKNVTLTMNHALSRLHLTIKKGANFTANAPLTKITLKSTAIDATGTMDLTTGAITPSKKSSETGTVELSTDGEITAEGIVKDFLLIPAGSSDVSKDIVIILTVNGKEASVSLTETGGLDIRSGIQNNVTLTIEDTGIKVTGVGVGVWGEGGSQEVQVDGNKLTVKLSEDAGIADDLIVQVTSNGSSVIVKAYSDSGKPLVIRNDATLIAPVENGSVSTFTITNITSDITVTLAYAKTRIVSINVAGVDKAPNVEGYVYGTADPIAVLEGRPSTLKATPGGGYDVDYFEMKGTKYENMEKVLIPDEVTEIDAYFRFTDWLGGVFSIGENKKVRFSRGNLWCDGTGPNYYTYGRPTVKSCGIESNQYESTPSSDDYRTINHISHFMWCADVNNSIAEKYSYEWDVGNVFLFTNKDATTPSPDFAVNGQKEFWRTLSGGADGEWNYLLNGRKTTYGSGELSANNHRYAAVKVNGMEGLLIFPDEFFWPEDNLLKDKEPTVFNASETNWNSRNYEAAAFDVLQSAGCVFLPAAGYRFGFQKDDTVEMAKIIEVGFSAYYWSSTTENSDIDNAYFLNFSRNNVFSKYTTYRRVAYSVRLVTDVK